MELFERVGRVCSTVWDVIFQTCLDGFPVRSPEGPSECLVRLDIVDPVLAQEVLYYRPEFDVESRVFVKVLDGAGCDPFVDQRLQIFDSPFGGRRYSRIELEDRLLEIHVSLGRLREFF